MSILANRYASDEMKDIWSPKSKIMTERRFWITVMKTQSELGFKIPSSAISDYEKVLESIDLESINRREKDLRHDVKARIDEFNSLAGHQYIHIGMTSRDLTENIEAYQIHAALKLINFKTLVLLYHLGGRIEEFKSLAIVGRSHNVPAQITTLGKRFATIAEELIFAQAILVNLIELFPIRGLKGPVGTSQDGLDLLGDRFEDLERVLVKSLGFERALDSTGQIYPRSIDFQVIASLVTLAAAPSNMATSIRLMAGHDLVSEGFKQGQVGSSAMPHKINTRSCERIHGLAAILKGHATMLGGISGGQWNEGDVSDSVVRRVAISDAFFAIDGLYETAITILRELVIFREVISEEIALNLPFLATSKLLLAAVKKGMGREEAHETIRLACELVSREKRSGLKTLLQVKLGEQRSFPLNYDEIEELFLNPTEFIGLSEKQCDRVIIKIKRILENNPDVTRYLPNPII